MDNSNGALPPIDPEKVQWDAPEAPPKPIDRTKVEWEGSGQGDSQGTTQSGSWTKTGAALGVAETALQAVSGFGAQIAGGLAGLGVTASRAIGGGADLPEPGDAVGEVESALTYEPRTREGKAISGAVQKPFAKWNDWADQAGTWTLNKTGDVGKATVIRSIIEGIPYLIGPKIPGKLGEAAAKGAARSMEELANRLPRDQAIESATREGVVLPPSEYGGAVGSTAQGMVGKAQTERLASEKNQSWVKRTARSELGINPYEPLDPVAIKARIAQEGAVYSELENIGQMKTDPLYMQGIAQAGRSYMEVTKGFPKAIIPEVAIEKERWNEPTLDSRSMIEAMKQLRQDGFENRRSMDQVKKRVGEVQLDIASAMEMRLERQATTMGKNDLVARFQKARKQIAKLHAVGEVMRPDGWISARELFARNVIKKDLDGGLKNIADYAGLFAKVFQDMESKGHYGPYSVVDTFAMVGGVASAASGHPGIAAVAGVAASRPLVQRGLLSKPYQKAFAKPKGKGGAKRAAQGALSRAGKHPLAAPLAGIGVGGEDEASQQESP